MRAWCQWCIKSIEYAERRNRYQSRPPDKPKFRNGFAALLKENLDDPFGEGNHELSDKAPDDDWFRGPEIVVPYSTHPRDDEFSDAAIFDKEIGTDGSSNVVDFEKSRAYG